MENNTDNFSTRVELLEKMKTSSTDDAPWQEFKKIYWDLIAGWARMFGCSKNQVQDIFQETMFCLMRDIKDIDKLRKEGGFRNYLRKSVLHFAIDALSKASVEEPPSEGKPKKDHDNESKLWRESVISKALDKAISDAGEKAYHAFCYLDLDEMKLDEASEKLGVKDERASKLRNHFIKVLKADCHDFMTSIEEEGLIDEIIGSDSEFINSIRGLATEKLEFKHTLFKEDLPPLKLVDRINFVNEQIRHNPLRSTSTSNLLLITRQEKRLPDGEKKNTLEMVIKDKALSSEWIELKHYQIIGRVDTCHIPLHGEGISRCHASITEKSDGWWVKDEHSTNGVFVNGKKVKESLLKNGDIIQISPRYLMIFSQKKLDKYMNMQFKYMRWWSQHFSVSLEQAAWEWVKTGLAAKFADKYRQQMV